MHRLLDVLHRAAKCAIAENCVAFKLDDNDANAIAFANLEVDGE